MHMETKTSLTQFSRFVHEMVWSKVMSREKTIIIEHERRKDTKGAVIIIAVWTLFCVFYDETKEPVYKSVRECRYRSIRK